MILIETKKYNNIDLPEQSVTPSQRQCGGIQYVLLNIYDPQLIWPASHSGGAKIRRKKIEWKNQSKKMSEWKSEKKKKIKFNSLSGKIISAHEMRLKSSLNELKETD